MYSQKKLLASKMAEMNLLKQEDNAIEKLRKQIDDQLNRLRIEEGEIKDKIRQEEIVNVGQVQEPTSVPLNQYQKEILRKQEMKKLGSVASGTPTDLEGQLQNIGLPQLNLQVSDHAETYVGDFEEEEEDEDDDINDKSYDGFEIGVDLE